MNEIVILIFWEVRVHSISPPSQSSNNVPDNKTASFLLQILPQQLHCDLGVVATTTHHIHRN